MEIRIWYAADIDIVINRRFDSYAFLIFEIIKYFFCQKLGYNMVNVTINIDEILPQLHFTLNKLNVFFP